MGLGVFQLSFWVMLALYIGVGTALALIARRFGVGSSSEYFAAGHRLGGLLSAMTYAATTYSAFMMIGLVGFAYATGVGSLGFELSYLLVTLLVLALFAKKVWSMGRSKDWVSASEMLSDLYGSRALGIYVAALYFVALIPYISAQFIGIGKIFEGLGLTYGGGVVFASILVLGWVVVAGMWSKATTDVFQGGWMIAAALAFLVWLLWGFMPAHDITLAEVSKALTDAGLTSVGKGFWTLPTLLAFTIPWWFFAVTNPQVVRKLFMPADERSLKSLIKYFGVYGLIYTLIVVFIGMVARGLTLEGVFPYIQDRDLVTPYLLLKAGPVLSSFIYVSIIAAAVTTANSI
ncbi:MAG: sodium:solute symporter family protein, partial [Desulfurococcales archaeon]|nr:sodium:solute symporter family protein [Desulfurococcales archaeon]